MKERIVEYSVVNKDDTIKVQYYIEVFDDVIDSWVSKYYIYEGSIASRLGTMMFDSLEEAKHFLTTKDNIEIVKVGWDAKNNRAINI